MNISDKDCWRFFNITSRFFRSIENKNNTKLPKYVTTKYVAAAFDVKRNIGKSLEIVSVCLKDICYRM